MDQRRGNLLRDITGMILRMLLEGVIRDEQNVFGIHNES